jgi:hypothetical protein
LVGSFLFSTHFDVVSAFDSSLSCKNRKERNEFLLIVYGASLRVQQREIKARAAAAFHRLHGHILAFRL